MEIQVRVEQLAASGHGNGILKEPALSLELTLEGVTGDKHAGFTKKADGRDQGVKRGTLVRNWRQWSAVSVEELERISDSMQIGKIEPTWLGANIAFSGHEFLTQIPKGSTIWFGSGAVLTVEGENAPCIGPGKEIAKHFDSVSPSSFPKTARNLRGLVGVVYRAGKISLGETATIVIYEAFDALTRPPQAR